MAVDLAKVRENKLIDALADEIVGKLEQSAHGVITCPEAYVADPLDLARWRKAARRAAKVLNNGKIHTTLLPGDTRDLMIWFEQDMAEEERRAAMRRVATRVSASYPRQYRK